MGVSAILGALGLAEAVGLPEVAGTVLDKASEALFDTRGKDILAEVQARLRAYTGAVPPNHDLERAIRLADLTACLVLLEQYRRVVDDDLVDQRGAVPPPFIAAARGWLHRQIGLCPALKLQPDGALVAEIDAALDRVLGRPAEAEAALTAARERAWTALTRNAGAAPPEFEALFHGRREGEPGWSALTVAFLREALKTNHRAEAAFMANRLAASRESLRRTEDRLAKLAEGVGRVDEQTARIEAKVDALLASGRGRDVAEAAGESGLSGETLRVAMLRLWAAGLGRDDLITELERWLAKYLEERLRGVNEDEAFRAALAEAHRRVEDGRLAEASAAVMDEFAREAAEETERQEERRRRRLRLLEEAIRFDELALNGPAAAAKLRLMAEIEGATDADARGARLFAKAGEFQERGDTRGDNPALLIAIATYRAALEDFARDRVPLHWATTQNNFGNALAMLGEREGGTARLEEAVTAYRAALEEFARDRVPLDWATTQNNLGNALQTLGERESGTARLEEAVTAYRAALEEQTRDRVPLDWAMTQNNLGNALATLGERESGTARLEEAVTAYSAALEEYAQDRVPLAWATTQNNLGTALQTLGERESGTARLEEAVTAYRAALEERTRDRVPLDWATTQNNLGNALQTLGGREGGTARLEEAVTAYRAALEERTRDRVPLAWATTQNNFGTALQTLGGREGGTARLDEAVTAYRAALEEQTRDRVPLDWAMTQNNLGNALATLGEREGGTARLEEAVTAYSAALEERTRDRVPLAWATTTANLGRAERPLAERRGDLMLAMKARSHIAAALSLFREAGHPPYIATGEAMLREADALVRRLGG